MKTRDATFSLSMGALSLGLGLTTCSMLLLQQFLTRIYSVLFSSGLAFLAISTTFLGLGSAGVAVFVLPKLFSLERTNRQVPRLALGYAITLVLGVVALVAVQQASGESATGFGLVSQVRGVIMASLMLLPAMFLVGLVISLILRAHTEQAHGLYAADLIGGGIGCLLVLPLMNMVGGDHGIFIVGALAAAGAALLAHAYQDKFARSLALVATLLLLGMPALNRDYGIIDVRSHVTDLAEADGWVLEDQEIERIWNPLARLGIFKTRDGSSLYIRIDSGCQTGIPSQERRFVQGHVEDTDFERLPYVLNRHDRFLEIGAGGGRGMVFANELGAERIVGVEINPGITSRSLDGYEGYGVGDWTRSDDNVDLITGEGRSYARSAEELFDTVTITFIQTGVASGSAAFALSEANLFTVEAFQEFMGRLDENGLFYVYRQGGNELLRLISMARVVLGDIGIEDIRSHLYVARNETNRAVFLIGRSPFTDEEVKSLDEACASIGIEVLYSPSGVDVRGPSNPFPARVQELRDAGDLSIGRVAELYTEFVHHPDYESLEATYIRSTDPEAFLRDSIVDVAAPTDDRPYYFFLGLNRWSDFPLYFDLDGVNILGGTVILLFWMAIAFTLFVALLILVPLLLRKRRGGTQRSVASFATTAYFMGLGLGYIAVQISFIQRFTLFLGHPVYAVSVVLMGFLVASGLGSFSSRALFDRGIATLPRALFGLAVLLVGYNFLLPFVFHSGVLSMGVTMKIIVSLLLILPLGFLMGLFFPHGLRMVNRVAPELVPWAWGANSAASILGSIVSLILAIHLGFAITAVFAAAAYVVLCLPSGRKLALLPAISPQAK
ncbi:MAG: hypothetical protein ACI8QS_001210 [Planctomycetota bacterium]|jgi:hypothetical protein